MNGHRCSVSGCCGPVAARGLCGAHYKRWRLYDDVFARIPIGSPLPVTRRKVERPTSSDGADVICRCSTPLAPGPWDGCGICGRPTIEHLDVTGTRCSFDDLLQARIDAGHPGFVALDAD